MTHKKYVIVLRHGPTNSNESINYNSFVDFVAKLIVYLNNFLISKGMDVNNITPKIYTSPYTRCIDTAKLVASYLEVIRNNKKVPIKTNSGIARWNIGTEPRHKSIERATLYGNRIYKKTSAATEDEICIYISHSSIIPALISGIVGRKLKKIKLHTTCLSIININNREMEIFNKSFR